MLRCLTIRCLVARHTDESAPRSPLPCWPALSSSRSPLPLQSVAAGSLPAPVDTSCLGTSLLSLFQCRSYSLVQIKPGTPVGTVRLDDNHVSHIPANLGHGIMATLPSGSGSLIARTMIDGFYQLLWTSHDPEDGFTRYCASLIDAKRWEYPSASRVLYITPQRCLGKGLE